MQKNTSLALYLCVFRAEDVGSQEASDRLAPWRRLEEHQCYVECLREEILLEQRRAEKDLEREQAHLRKQHSESELFS